MTRRLKGVPAAKPKVKEYVSFRKCENTHARIPVGKGFIIGKGCHDFKDDADIYIALDSTAVRSGGYPWDTGVKAQHIYFRIDNMKAPKIEDFRPMVAWICNQLQKGKSVHIACMAGHGRTGLVLAAVLAHAKGMKDAIHWLRKNYCDRAVESQEQVDFLVKNYGCTSAEPSGGSWRHNDYQTDLDSDSRLGKVASLSSWRPRLWAD